MVKVLIVEQSYLIRKGLVHVLKQFSEVGDIEYLATNLGMEEVLMHFNPDLLIINSSLAASVKSSEAKVFLSRTSSVAYLVDTILPVGSPANQISIYDSKATIAHKLEAFVRVKGDEEKSDETEELTPRERLILKNVALGLTNKEIASNLYISTHTVISHRKNITRKLDIKSVSGLTVYAIINGIIKMEDIS